MANRKVNGFGDINIPDVIRNKLDIKPGDEISFVLKDDKIILSKLPKIQCNCCHMPGTSDEVKEYNNVRLCKQCVKKFSNMFD